MYLSVSTNEPFKKNQKLRKGLMWDKLVIGNQDLSVMWKILKIINILIRVLYLMFYPLMLVKSSSDDKVNESVSVGGDKSNNDSSFPGPIYIPGW